MFWWKIVATSGMLKESRPKWILLNVEFQKCDIHILYKHVRTSSTFVQLMDGVYKVTWWVANA